MRRTIMLCVWLAAPVVLLAYHYGPGQARLATEQASRAIAEARACEAREDWASAQAAWGQSLSVLPQEETAARLEVRLAQARSRMYVGDLPEAIADMESLLTEAQESGADADFRRELRATLAGGQYYAAWLMRLEGATAEEWLQPVDAARQNFRLLSETTTDSRLAEDYRKNLEATIRLERMDLSELQGLPLPKKCSSCKNVCQKCRSQSKSKCEPKEPQKKDARGAGFNQAPKGGS